MLDSIVAKTVLSRSLGRVAIMRKLFCLSVIALLCQLIVAWVSEGLSDQRTSVMPSGGSTAPNVSTISARVTNVLDYGAKCDVATISGISSPYSIGAGSNVLSSPLVTFTSADIGKIMILPG